MPEKAAELLDKLGLPSEKRGWDELGLGKAIGTEVRSGGANLFPPRVTS